MVIYQEPEIDAVFSALSDANRRAIIAQLAHQPTAVTKLVTPRDMSLQGVMKHLRVLENAGLISREKRGRVVECRLNPTGLQTAAQWISEYEEFWRDKFDVLAAHLDSITASPPANRNNRKDAGS